MASDLEEQRKTLVPILQVVTWQGHAQSAAPCDCE